MNIFIIKEKVIIMIIHFYIIIIDEFVVVLHEINELLLQLIITFATMVNIVVYFFLLCFCYKDAC